MASAALVDSNVFIALTRRREDSSLWLGSRFEDIYTCGMVRLEVLRGMKNPRERDAMAAFFNVLCNVPTDNNLWEQAAELGWELDRRGLIIPGPDILIAACALRAGVPVMTADKHFDDIPGLMVIAFPTP
ncbi:MAG: PIN domain-containing protein [Verrucomicrobia bacterium]|nr:PIN domain-containing protein [Verrucomicrobiota bacterium]